MEGGNLGNKRIRDLIGSLMPWNATTSPRQSLLASNCEIFLDEHQRVYWVFTSIIFRDSAKMESKISSRR